MHITLSTYHLNKVLLFAISAFCCLSIVHAKLNSFLMTLCSLPCNHKKISICIFQLTPLLKVLSEHYFQNAASEGSFYVFIQQ